jgi:flap endonuclease-1
MTRIGKGMKTVGVNLRPIIFKRETELIGLRGKTFAVDANNILYQFLSLIRTRGGEPLTDNEGHTTSHLTGLVYRSTRLISDFNMQLIFVFDGKPPSLKLREIKQRRSVREKAEREWRKAFEEGDLKKAFSKAVRASRLTKEMIEDSKRTLRLLGIPLIQAPEEAEAQTAELVKRGDVWASNSRDYDTLLFGTPRLVRYLTISGQEYLPSKGITRRLVPEIIELRDLLHRNGIDQAQLVDLAILIGTDFNQGIKGVGPKKGLALVKEYGSLENMPKNIKTRLPEELNQIRSIFLKPKVTYDYDIRYGPTQEEALYEFLCEERGFSRRRLDLAVERMRRFHSAKRQKSLEDWTENRGTGR